MVFEMQRRRSNYQIKISTITNKLYQLQPYLCSVHLGGAAKVISVMFIRDGLHHKKTNKGTMIRQIIPVDHQCKYVSINWAVIAARTLLTLLMPLRNDSVKHCKSEGTILEIIFLKMTSSRYQTNRYGSKTKIIKRTSRAKFLSSCFIAINTPKTINWHTLQKMHILYMDFWDMHHFDMNINEMKYEIPNTVKVIERACRFHSNKFNIIKGNKTPQLNIV